MYTKYMYTIDCEECVDYNIANFIGKRCRDVSERVVHDKMKELEETGKTTVKDIEIIKGWPKTEQKALELGLTLQEYIDEFGYNA